MADGLGWVGFKNFGLGWVGFSKSDPRPTLIQTAQRPSLGALVLSVFRILGISQIRTQPKCGIIGSEGLLRFQHCFSLYG
jgi:hypothetical protein